MVGLGIVLALVGAACVWVATRSRKKIDTMLATETLSIPELEEQRAISESLGSGGRFRRYCEVVGTTHPAPVGLLRAPLSGEQCVWYAHQVERRYRYHDHDDQGRRRVTTRSEQVSEELSPHGWALAQDGRTIGLDHGGRRPDGVEQVASRFEPAPGTSLAADVVAALTGGDQEETLGYQHTEWILRAGVPMYVLGDVHDALGPLIIGPPQQPGQPFVVSTKSEEELTAAGRRSQLRWARGGAAVAALGLALLVAGLVF